MTKDKALHKYFEDFMKMAYPDAPVREDDYHYTYLKTNVPDDAILPYLTYPFIDSAFDEGDQNVSLEIWEMTEGEAHLNDVARKLRLYIEDNNIIECDEGNIWVKTGIPFAQTMETEWEDGPKCKYINLLIEYLTRY